MSLRPQLVWSKYEAKEARLASSQSRPDRNEVFRPRSVVWTPDETPGSCERCSVKFSFFNRRHHCRACRLPICNRCSPHLQQIAGYDQKQRVCNACFKKEDLPEEELKRSVVEEALYLAAVAEGKPVPPLGTRERKMKERDALIKRVLDLEEENNYLKEESMSWKTMYYS